MAETRPHIKLPAEEDRTSPLEVTRFDKPGGIMSFEDEQKAIAEVKTAFGTTPEEQEKGYQEFMAEIEADIARYEREDSGQQSQPDQRPEALRQARTEAGAQVSAFDRVLDSVKESSAALLDEETINVFEPTAISAQAEVIGAVVAEYFDEEEAGDDIIDLDPEDLEEDELESDTIAYEPQDIASERTSPLGVRGLFSKSDRVATKKVAETDPDIDIAEEPDDDTPTLQELVQEAKGYSDEDPIFTDGVFLEMDDEPEPNENLEFDTGVVEEPDNSSSVDISFDEDEDDSPTLQELAREDDKDKIEDPIFTDGVFLEMDDAPMETLESVDASATELRQIAETASNNSKTDWKNLMSRAGRTLKRLAGMETTALVRPIEFSQKILEPLAKEVPEIVRESEKILFGNLGAYFTEMTEIYPRSVKKRRELIAQKMKDYYKLRKKYNAEHRGILEAENAEDILRYAIDKANKLPIEA
ncbi:MAG: hypothetical protein HQ530_02260 [Parcubacteria group bacterium]|nr:hypothetical protein [Parcubacteria group bacterium]